jgi:integrase/DNA-binding XRE family transcriptional regulator
MPRANKRVRVRGERNLYRAGEEYWAGATPPGGRQAQWENLGRVGIMEARRRRDELVAAVRRREVVAAATPAPRTTTVREVADLYLAECEQLVAAGVLSPRTQEVYEQALRRHFSPDYGERSITSISAEDLVQWHRTMQRRRAAKWTIRSRWTPVRGTLVYATRHRLIPYNPADLLTRRERSGPGESRVRFLDEDEMRALLAATPTRYVGAVATMMFTGLRVSEALGLVWADIDFRREQILVRHQMHRHGERGRLKSKGSTREVIMIPRLARILRQHAETTAWWRANDLVFTSTVGTSMTYRRLSEAVRRATADAGLHGVSSHVLRHTFASILIYRGCDAMFVARQLGHTTPSTTWDTYVHLFNAARQTDKAREQLDAEFGGVLEDGVPEPAGAAPVREGGAEPAQPVSIQDRLNALKARGGLSGQDVAKLLDASEQTVSRWRTGKGEPQRTLAIRLAELEQLVDGVAATCRPHEARAAVFAIAAHRMGAPTRGRGKRRGARSS